MQLRSSIAKACLLVFALIIFGARLTPGQANQPTPAVARRAQQPVPAPQYIRPHDYDHPNDFITSEIVATVEKPLSVISNGRLISAKDNPEGTRSFDWKIDQPHATYLTSIIVGEFVPVVGEYAGVPISTNVYRSELEEGKITAARLPEMVKFFSEKTGVKYPYAKYAQ